MNFLEDFCKAVSALPFGEHFALIGMLVTLTIVLATFVLFALVKRFRRFDKSIALCITLALISLTTLKVFCDYACGMPINKFSLALALAILPVIFVLAALLFTLKATNNSLYNSEKRLIDELLSKTVPCESLLNQVDFSQNPFKRVEYLKGQKGFYEHSFSDFNLNPSHVEKYINELLTKGLNNEDYQEVNQIYNSLQKYKLKNLSNFERNDFSTKLQTLIKLTAKYDNSNFDVS